MSDDKNWGFSEQLGVLPASNARTELDAMSNEQLSARKWLKQMDAVRDNRADSWNLGRTDKDVTTAELMEAYAASRLAAAEQRNRELEQERDKWIAEAESHSAEAITQTLRAERAESALAEIQAILNIEAVEPGAWCIPAEPEPVEVDGTLVDAVRRYRDLRDKWDAEDRSALAEARSALEMVVTSIVEARNSAEKWANEESGLKPAYHAVAYGAFLRGIDKVTERICNPVNAVLARIGEQR